MRTVMEGRKLLRDVVNFLAQAFDEAWASMAHTVEPARAKKVKSSLARAIVAQAKGRAPKDYQALKQQPLAPCKRVQARPPVARPRSTALRLRQAALAAGQFAPGAEAEPPVAMRLIAAFGRACRKCAKKHCRARQPSAASRLQRRLAPDPLV